MASSLPVSRRGLLTLAASSSLLPLGLGGWAWSAGSLRAPRLSVGHREATTTALAVHRLDAHVRADPTLLGRTLALSLTGSADAEACMAFSALSVDVIMGAGHVFHAWSLDRTPGRTLAPIRFQALALAEALPRLRLRAEGAGAEPLDVELPFSLRAGREVLPLREGTYHLALQAPHARPVDWRLLSAAPAAERRCKGALACDGDRLSPWPGAVVVSLEVEAREDVPLAG